MLMCVCQSYTQGFCPTKRTRVFQGLACNVSSSLTMCAYMCVNVIRGILDRFFLLDMARGLWSPCGHMNDRDYYMLGLKGSSFFKLTSTLGKGGWCDTTNLFASNRYICLLGFVHIKCSYNNSVFNSFIPSIYIFHL